MSTLTGFVAASQPEIKNANKLNTITRGNSPFQHNVKFTVTGFSYEKAQIDGKVADDARLNPVLVTNIGSLFLTTLLRSKVNSEHKIVEPNGTFNNFVRETITANSGKNNGEILTAIVKGCKDKELIVERVPYAAVTADGRTYAASMVNINFV